MTLYTKSILKAVDSSDGLRISVMSRHTLPDGLTPDSRITPQSFDIHMPSLAPPPKLVGDYYRRNLPWNEYEERYREYLRTPKVSEDVRILASQSKEKDITLLCIEYSPERCHRRILAEECGRYEPSIIIIHR